MKAKSQEIIEEIEACKDILWFLKGYTANTDYSITGISQFHINALSDVINELQSRILKDKQGMQTFKLEIQEVLSKVIEIEAETLSDAIDIAHDMYNSEEIVLDASDFVTNTIDEHIE